MVSIGYFLSGAEFGPKELVRQAKQAADAGFERLWISDHYHPWNDTQGQSPFVWSVIGADPWPEADVRLEMLEEALEVIRLPHRGGTRSHRGKHYTGFDEVHVAQTGPDLEEFFQFWRDDVAPQLT